MSQFQNPYRLLLCAIVTIVFIWCACYGFILVIDSFVAYDVFNAQLLLSRLFVAVLLSCILLFFIKYYRRLDLSNHANAFNLATFRILYFGFFAIGGLFFLNDFYKELVTFAQMSENMRTDVPFFNWFPILMPFNKPVITIATGVFFIASVSSMIGFKTRWAMWLFVIAALYLFAIPNFYGKINHNHHILWIAIIMSCAPCFQVLSVDSYVRKRLGNSMVQYETALYERYFLLLWIMMGVIYLFPGFWKIWSSGLDWIFTGNLKNQMYYKRLQLNGWKPLIGIECYPMTLTIGAFFTVFFELLFLPIVLLRKTRVVAIFTGLFFHFLTLIFLNIFFIVLVVCYLSFIPWDKWFQKKGDSGIYHSFYRYPKKYIVIPSVLLFLASAFGIAKCNSWPFSVYPTFDNLITVDYPTFTYQGVLKNGNKTILDRDVLTNVFKSERLWQMERNTVNPIEKDSVFNKEVFKIYHKVNPNLLKVEVIKSISNRSNIDCND